MPVKDRSSCGKAVEQPCISCGSLDDKIFFQRAVRAFCATRACGSQFRTALRLIACTPSVECLVPTTAETTQILTVSTPSQRFEESIAGRPYLIEVSFVALDRWRACIVKAPGVPTALMPFYGQTPDEAAGQLRQWLTRAHARAAASTRRT